ncbi:MAG: hypothetical protein ACK5TR_04715 [Alphaproteobacteria bacterium]|nr:hypothetical protein [Alphaproteobacteria bacterium]
MVRILKLTILGLIAAATLAALGIFFTIMHDKAANPYVAYWETHFHQPTRPFLAKALKTIPRANHAQQALILAADVAQNDLSLVLEKGYALTLVDQGLIYYDLFLPKGGEKSFILKDLDDPALPQVSLVMASFILPFYAPSAFQQAWQTLDGHLSKGGYFIGTFLGPRTTLFGAPKKDTMTYLTKDDVEGLFQGYEILLWEARLIPWENPKGVEERIEVLARKLS